MYKRQVVAERQNYLLYDRMVAFHVQRGAAVPLNAADFYAGLKQRFPERDWMFFLPAQAVEYDRARMVADGVQQLSLLVTDEDVYKRQLLDQEISASEPGIISFDSYWDDIKEEAALRSDPAVREVLDKSQVLENRIKQAMPRREYLPPVSYTHLDVYKRQTIYKTLL